MTQDRDAGGARFSASTSSAQIKTGFQRYERPVYDYSSKISPCRAGCPAGHDIAWALYMVAEGRSDLADETFREDSPFPSITGRVCYHPCESVCNRKDYDGAVAINALERVFGDIGLGKDPGRVEVRYAETIGVIGSGPAGLTVAYHLALLGYDVTVYEARDRPGGVLTYGIPVYRLPREIVSAEIARLEQLGIRFVCGVRVGQDVTLEQLRIRHRALFLGVGLSNPRLLPIPVPDHPRVRSGIGFLQAIARNEAAAVRGSTAVIGGGDVAIDAARSALRMGAETVKIFCPEAVGQLPAHPEEIAAAWSEGIRVCPSVLPTSLTVEGDRLRLDLDRVAAATRASDGSMHFETTGPSSDSGLFDDVLYAVGQRADLGFLPHSLASRATLTVGPWGQTALAGIFAGGDVVGTYNVVNAIGSGKRAAIGIDTYLRALDSELLQSQIQAGGAGAVSMRSYRAWRNGERMAAVHEIVPLQDVNLDYFPLAERSHRPARERGVGDDAFQEINLPLSASGALAEAKRCFNCGMCNMCGNCYRYCPDSAVIQMGDWGFGIDLDHCKGCGICVQECPRSAMSMIPEHDARQRDARDRDSRENGVGNSNGGGSGEMQANPATNRGVSP